MNAYTRFIHIFTQAYKSNCVYIYTFIKVNERENQTENCFIQTYYDGTIDCKVHPGRTFYCEFITRRDILERFAIIQNWNVLVRVKCVTIKRSKYGMIYRTKHNRNISREEFS